MRIVKIVLIFLLIIAVVSGAYVIVSLRREVNELSRELDQAQQAVQTPTPEEVSEPNYVVIYLIESAPLDFHLVAVQRQVWGPISPELALQELLNGPLAHEDLYESVPQTAKLLGLHVENGLATANFSQEIVDDFGGGSLMESYLVQAIVNTLTEFAGIDEVQIMVEGEIVESLGGHILITSPLKRSA